MEKIGEVAGSLATPWWWTVTAVAIPVLGCLLWWWYELWYAVPLSRVCAASGTRLPPGHMGLPFFGEMATFLWYFKILRRPDDFINAKRRKYGDGEGLYRTHLFGSPSIIACFPLVSRFVLRSEDDFLLQWPNLEIVGTTSLVSVQGQAHARVRGYVMSSINRPDALSRITHSVQPLIVTALHSWAQKGRIRAHDEVKKVTFRNIGKLFVSFEPGPLLDNIDRLFRGLVKGYRAQPFNFPGTAFRRALQCRKQLEEIFNAELEKKKARMECHGATRDLMDGLMQIEDETGNKPSDKEVLDNIISLLNAGYESTSIASTWAIYYLAKYPDVLRKLREENIAISQSKNGEFITSEDVSKMTYTNKVVEETIRLANIAAFVFRLATKDVDYKGYRIPKGWKVILWFRYIHTNPENFDDPMCFDPDRWNEPAKPGTFKAFGEGPRLCVGNMLARIQVAILLHHLSVGYKWELINPDAGISYLPHPIPTDGVEVTFHKL